jgi:hypothetical protein
MQRAHAELNRPEKELMLMTMHTPSAAWPLRDNCFKFLFSPVGHCSFFPELFPAVAFFKNVLWNNLIKML